MQFEYWAGNPAVEIINGIIHTLDPDKAGTGGGSNISNALSDDVVLCRVPNFISLQEFVDFICTVPIQLGQEASVSSPRSTPRDEKSRDFPQIEPLPRSQASLSSDHRLKRPLEIDTSGFELRIEEQHGPAIPVVNHLRVLHGSKPQKYLVLMKVKNGAQVVAALNKRRFNMIEEDLCEAYFVIDGTVGRLKNDGIDDNVEQSAVIASPKMSPRSKLELFEQMSLEWRCPICMECGLEITELGGGAMLTILCGHTFHWRCLVRWCDQTCAVCRFKQYPFPQSSCEECNSDEHKLRICLVCGFIGCAGGENHSSNHFRETSHAYALELDSQRVWDYSGEGYVHRLLTNTDGKMVEHTPSPPGGALQSPGESARVINFDPELRQCAEEQLNKFLSRSSPAVEPKKVDSVVQEFNALLSSQLDEQKNYYTAILESIPENEGLAEAKARLAKLKKQAKKSKAELAKKQLEEENIRAQTKQIMSEVEDAERKLVVMEKVNQKLAAKYPDCSVVQAEPKKMDVKERNRQVADLKQQIKDIQCVLQMRAKCENDADVRDGHTIITGGVKSNRRRR